MRWALIIFMILIFIWPSAENYLDKFTQKNLSKMTETDKEERIAFSLTPTNLHANYGEIIFIEESPFGQVFVSQNKDMRGLYINYRNMCFNKTYSEKSLAKLTGDNIPQNSKVVNIGLGCGHTATETVKHPNVGDLTVIEINPTVVKASKEYFYDINHPLFESEKATLLIENGAEYVRKTQNKYNAIIIDIEEVDIIQSSPLYTKEYMQIMKEKLADGGILSMWSFNPNHTFSKILFNTFKDVFPYVELRIISGDLNIFASTRPMTIPNEAEEKVYLKRKELLQNPSELINSLDRPALSTYFDSKKFFNQPACIYIEDGIEKLDKCE